MQKKQNQKNKQYQKIQTTKTKLQLGNAETHIFICVRVYV